MAAGTLRVCTVARVFTQPHMQSHVHSAGTRSHTAHSRMCTRVQELPGRVQEQSLQSGGVRCRLTRSVPCGRVCPWAEDQPPCPTPPRGSQDPGGVEGADSTRHSQALAVMDDDSLGWGRSPRPERLRRPPAVHALTRVAAMFPPGPGPAGRRRPRGRMDSCLQGQGRPSFRPAALRLQSPRPGLSPSSRCGQAAREPGTEKRGRFLQEIS